MKLNLYAVRDELVGFKPPFNLPNDAVAERYFKSIVNDERNEVGVDPKYYDLYFLGELDDQTGCIIPEPQPRLVATGISLKETKNV